MSWSGGFFQVEDKILDENQNSTITLTNPRDFPTDSDDLQLSTEKISLTNNKNKNETLSVVDRKIQQCRLAFY